MAACAVTAAQRISSGVGVSVRSHFGMARKDGSANDDLLSDTDIGKIHCRWVGGACRGGLHVVSAFLRTSEGLSKRNLDLLQELARTLKGISGPWVVAADWHMSPHLPSSSGRHALASSTIVAPVEGTCGAKMLDFFVVSHGLAHAVMGIAVVEDTGIWPHSPVRLYIHAAPRRLLLRKLAAPREVGGVLPLGCLTREATVDAPTPPPNDANLKGLYVAWLARAKSLWDKIVGLAPSKQG